MAPVAVGTETDGSLVTPPTRASLDTVKPIHGLVGTTDNIPTNARYDTDGPMGKTVKDVEDLPDVLVDNTKTEIPRGDYKLTMTMSRDDIRVGTFEPEKWKMDDRFVRPVSQAKRKTERLQDPWVVPQLMMCSPT